MIRAPLNYPQIDPKANLLHNIRIVDLAIKGLKLKTQPPATQERLAECYRHRGRLCRQCRRAYAFDDIPIPAHIDAILKGAEP